MDTNDSSPSVSETIAEAPAPAPSPATTETSTPSSDVAAPPSSAPPGESKESLLSAVMKVVKTNPDADAVKLPSDGATPAPTEPQPEEADGQGAEDDVAEDPTDEELGRYHSRTRKRISKLLDQRNQARAEVEALRADASTAQGLRQYLNDTGIGKEDFSVLLDIGASLQRGDWQTFYAGIQPYMQLAEEALGLRLPPDLAQRVQQGHMTTETARQYSQERHARQLAEANAARTTQYVEQSRQEQHVAAVQHGITQAVSGWENSVRQTDPDYGHKQDAVKNMLWAVVREKGAPSSPEHAVEIAKEAYARVNQQVAQWVPKRAATAPVPSSVHRSTGVVAQPNSLMEAAMAGLARSRRTA